MNLTLNGRLTRRIAFQLAVILLLLFLRETELLKTQESGCANGIAKGFQNKHHPSLAACPGSWSGHIANAFSVCARGWEVCDWRNELVRSITWKEAVSFPGCYAFNAAQEDGNCMPCLNNIDQDDMAGVGDSCPHKNYYKKSCISEGRIDHDCCQDKHNHTSCSYQPGITTGVLCCKQPGVAPHIFIPPRRMLYVNGGGTFVLSCRAIGTPSPTITWMKDGKRLPLTVGRISVFESGYLIVSDAKLSDAGNYECVASNSAGSTTALSQIIITNYPSGCADDTTDGLFNYEEVHACRGQWLGHVKRARHLCKKGWQVCSPRHVGILKMLTWSDALYLDGCYAYNAANTLNLCTVCRRENMAGFGNKCGRMRITHDSCLAEGRIDVFESKAAKRCEYREGLTNGVLCCQKPHKGTTSFKWKKPVCQPHCANNGVCFADNHCRCSQGYKGAWCQIPYCPGGCMPNSTCIKPGLCRCNSGYLGPKCQLQAEFCSKPCLHGGRCRFGKCKCPPTHRGSYCQLPSSKIDPSTRNEILLP